MLLPSLTSCQSFKLVLAHESNKGSSRATAYVDSNKIVTEKGSVTYLTYLENENEEFQIVVSKKTR